MATDSFAVILNALVIPPFMTLAKALASVDKTPVLDHIVQAKSSWGILAEHQPEALAQALHQGLTKAGMPSLCVRDAQVVVPPEPILMTALETLDFKRVVMIGVAGVPEVTVKTTHVKEGPSAGQKILNTTVLMTTGIPLKLGGKTRVVEKTSTQTESLFFLDLVLENPFERRRMDALNFNYACLDARKGYQALGNLRLLVEDLFRLAPQADINHGVRLFQEKRPLNEMGYATLADLDRELRWRLTLQKLSRA